MRRTHKGAHASVRGKWTLTPIDEPVVVLLVCLRAIATSGKQYGGDAFGSSGMIVVQRNVLGRTNRLREELLRRSSET